MAKTNDSASATTAVDEELIDTLIAISVVAKRLAAKLRQNQENNCESEEHDNEQKNEVITAIDTVVTKGNDFLGKAKDFIICAEILITAATGLKAVLEKYDGGDSDE